jgi:Ca-activated chloride channel family protein
MEEIKREGIDVVIALDVSNSMLSEDIPPSRLESAKHELVRFVEGLRGDRVGLVAFAGTAIEHCPLTTDYSAVKLLVNIMEPNLIPEQGTAIAEAIYAAQRAFVEDGAESRVIVVITDGEDQEQEAVDAAKKAAEDGITVYTIGMGTAQGAPIPLYDAQGRSTGFRRDKSNQVIMTRLNETLLQQIAEAGGGRFLRGTRNAEELEAIWEDISAMEQTELGQMQYTAFEDRYQYFVFPAFLLLLLEFLISERRGRPRWLTLFGTKPEESRA